MPVAQTQPKCELELLSAAWVVGFLRASASQRLTLILKWYAKHKAINFIPEYIILMRIKRFCIHILPLHLKRPKF